MEKTRFDIILVSWNRLDYLKRTIASLIYSEAIKDCERFIIVDNGSTQDGVQEFLLDIRRTHGAYLVLMPHNRGWGTAVNNALGLSRAPYLLILNNDVEFDHQFHSKMLKTFKNQPKIGILGVWRHIAHGFVQNGVQNEWFREMDDVPAVGWMLHKEAMEIAGMLPEHGPCDTKGGNGEDNKYTQRMKEIGYLVGVPPEDVARHIDGY